MFIIIYHHLIIMQEGFIDESYKYQMNIHGNIEYLI